MLRKTESEYVIITVFLVGIIVAIYYLISVATSGVNAEVVLEKTVLVGIIISILIVLAILLFKEIDLREQIDAVRQGGVSKPARKRTAKDVKKDMMRKYRDMGALKIIFQDKIIDKETYEKEIKELEKEVGSLKKEHEKLSKK